MESVVYFVMGHGTMVITVLLGSIILCVFGLLIMSFHSPKDMVAQEVGTVERLEGVLRQMLSDQQWTSPRDAAVDDQSGLLKDQIASLEKELTEKQKQIDSMGTGQEAEAQIAPMKLKVRELEEKLAEYSVIEEDIADLSRFRQENDDLKRRITEVTGITSEQALTMPWDEFEKIVKEKKVKSAKETATTTIEKSE